MRKKTIMRRALVAIAIVLGVQTNANAQLGSLLNKAKQKAESAVGKTAANKAGEGAATVAQTGKAPELPWTMGPDVDRYATDPEYKSIDELIKNLAEYSFDGCTKLCDMMVARYVYDVSKQRAMQMTNQRVPDEIEKEISRFHKFYGALMNDVVIYSPIKVFFDEKGEPQVTMKENQRFNLNGAGTELMRDGDGARFVTPGTFDTDFLEGKYLEAAKKNNKHVANAWALSHVAGKGLDKALEQQIMETCVRAGTWGQYFSAAMKKNSPENITRRARPAAGGMNGQLHAKALALAKASDSSVVDVIITNNQWTVKTEAGVPKYRMVSGYWLRKDAHGTRASSHSWCQDYQGGGKYGSLRNFGVGVESPFYIK